MVQHNEFPRNIVTFVFTDIENSTLITQRLEEQRGIGYYEREMRDPHRQRLQRTLSQEHGGFEVQRQGDGHLYVFQDAADALRAVVSLQYSLRDEPIGCEIDGQRLELKVRIGVHTSRIERDPQPVSEFLVEYPGTDTNFAARVGALGAGGQIIVSDETHAQYSVIGIEACRYHEWPNRFLKSFNEPHAVYELLYFAGQEPCEPGLRFFPQFHEGEHNHYVDRKGAQDAVFAQFRDKKRDGTTSRLVTLKAEGGMGKTRLAVACAVRMVGLFAGHAHFVDLETALPSAESVAQAIGQMISPPVESPLPDVVFAALKARGEKRTLLILDNYESVQNENVARYLAKLVTETRGVHLLVTGRTAVGVSDIEQIVSLDGGMSEGEARELFIARARLRAGMDWNPSEAEKPDLARLLKLTAVDLESGQICAIPLAVELVAAWVGILTLREIADGLEQTTLGEMSALPPDTVTSGPERHVSLDRSFRWSYDLMGRQVNGPRLQRAFAASSLFADSFEAATLAVVIQDDSTRTDLIRLHNASLVRRFEVDGQTRYYLHRFPRAFAALRLREMPDVAAIEWRFLKHYCDLVQYNSRRLQLADAISRAVLDKEWRNAMSALAIAERTEESITAALFFSLGQFLEFRGLYTEWQDLVARTSNAVEFGVERFGNDSPLSAARGGILSARGLIHMGAGHSAEALKCFEEAREVLLAGGLSYGAGVTLHNMGEAYAALGQIDRAIEIGEEALSLWRNLQKNTDDVEDKRDYRRSEGQTLHDLALVHGRAGDHDKAMRLLIESLRIRRECGDRLGEARTLATLGEGYGAAQAWDDAMAAFDATLVIFRELGDVMGEVTTMFDLARVYTMTWHFAPALILAREVVNRLENTQARVELEGARVLVAELEVLSKVDLKVGNSYVLPFSFHYH